MLEWVLQGLHLSKIFQEIATPRSAYRSTVSVENFLGWRSAFCRKCLTFSLWKLNGLYAGYLKRNDTLRASRWRTCSKDGTKPTSLRCQNSKSGSNRKTVLLCGLWTKKVVHYWFRRCATCFDSRRFGVFAIICCDWNVRFWRRWLKNNAVWNVTPCSQLETYWRFGET
jgi:hypothetical protein